MIVRISVLNGPIYSLRMYFISQSLPTKKRWPVYALQILFLRKLRKLVILRSSQWDWDISAENST